MANATKNAEALLDLLAKAGIDPKVLREAQQNVMQTEAEDVEAQAREAAEGGGFGWAKGRIYVSDDLLKAVAKTQKTGTPQVVTSETKLEDGRTVTHAVQTLRTNHGGVALQRLYAKKG